MNGSWILNLVLILAGVCAVVLIVPVVSLLIIWIHLFKNLKKFCELSKRFHALNGKNSEFAARQSSFVRNPSHARTPCSRPESNKLLSRNNLPKKCQNSNYDWFKNVRDSGR